MRIRFLQILLRSIYACTYHLFAGRLRPLVSVITTLLFCKDYFSSSSVISHTFCVLCMYLKFGHHPHPLGYLCTTFHFFRRLHCWANPWKKLLTQSLTQSLIQLILMCREPKHQICVCVCKVYTVHKHTDSSRISIVLWPVNVCQTPVL